MMSTQQLEQVSLPSQQLDKLIQDTLESLLSTRTYSEPEIPLWINEITQLLMTKLVQFQKPFKYLINCLIMQRKGAQVVITQSNYWDTGLDSACTVVWPKQKINKAQQNKSTIQCMVSVYAMSTLNSNSAIKSDL